MSPEWLARFPLIFDIITGAVFVGGCLLLWLNLKPRAPEIVLMPKLHSEQAVQEPAPHVGSPPDPAGQSEFVAASPHTAPSQDTGDLETHPDDANSYASHVSSALSKFRKTKPADSGAS